ncbi:uncharacterized protein MONOS_1335 [Monocercomonoides exilis]|uniref:uncharacterized protein n=1 Tax=Monocercomonoides exilis TaxID=2049356 RepID=UPI00355A58A0|nr:hypothetical protein MONOS_1335 [Monocercomonoides exilis]|eukprot:MONOS_1335.1-p1 / transcript=MONOS_1335.1 / gene=MONOS_1335 / organism=Monocercomonoides_exilis_PA203 / gene_product=unspecified product / transcript_product=unspecified product / location=Mono_scaffold00023:39683-42664(+) / protein_length=994 / sequence_SO=supercontig / SO=protein_coding / is_pseudo=false
MFLFVSIFCCVCNISCVDKKGDDDMQAIREKGDTFFLRNVNCTYEGIDCLSLNSTTRFQECEEIIEGDEGNIDKMHERCLEHLSRKTSFMNLDDFSLRKENDKSITECHSEIKYKEMQFNKENEVEVDGENGVDSDECGMSLHKPCKTIKKAVEHCKPEGKLLIHTAESCNKFDTEPIIIDGRHIELKNRDQNVIGITTALDEKKVKNGDALFCVKGKGYFYIGYADICVDTKRESGRNQGLLVVEGEGSQTKLENTNISNLETVNELSCVLIECKSGELLFQSIEISHFVSSCALILAESSPKIEFSHTMLDTITSKSETQSVLTVTGGCQSAKFDGCTFKNCWSTEHSLGGAIYLEITNSEHSCMFYQMHFTNCSCESANANTDRLSTHLNDESKGGAMLIQATDEVTKTLKLELKDMEFTNCAAEKGEYIYLSFPTGREQIDEDQFYFEMEGIYGKKNYILLENRKDGGIIDLMADKENILPYHSERIFIGGEKASNEKTCGRKEEPCSQLSGMAKHATWSNDMSIYIIETIFVNEPFFGCQVTSFSSMTNSSLMPSSKSEQNRGTLRIGSNMKNEDAIAVFGDDMSMYSFLHLDIEYPDAVEGDALSVLYGIYDLRIVDVVFRPWYTGLKGENVLGGEGKLLPYQLIKSETFFSKFTQLIIYGRNGNITPTSQRKSDKAAYSFRAYQNAENVENLNNGYKEDNPLCSWDSGLVFMNNVQSGEINDSSFIDIGDGAILSSFSSINFYNCSFTNNHPAEAGWEKYPSLRHNIRAKGNRGIWIRVKSLSPGSDGLDGKPFGMLSDVKAVGTAIENMDSYFFSPVLKNVTLKREETNNNNELQDKEENEKEIEAVVHGSYLIPCGLTIEVSKKKKGEEMKWTNCPVSEYTNETEMKVRIPPSLFEVDDYASVICRLTYSSGIIDGEKKHSTNVILVKQKKDDPKAMPTTQLVVIIVSVSVSTVVAVVVVIVIAACVVRRKKRRQYKEIKDASH